VSERAERGFDEAVSRLREWIETGDYLPPTAVPDALEDLYRMEEAEKKRLGEAVYFAQRDKDPLGRVVGGLVYARGLDTHSGALADRIEGSRPFRARQSTVRGGDTVRGPGVRVVWRSFSELPPPGRPEAHGRDVMYDQSVQGRDVLETFAEGTSFFAKIRGTP